VQSQTPNDELLERRLMVFATKLVREKEDPPDYLAIHTFSPEILGYVLDIELGVGTIASEKITEVLGLPHLSNRRKQQFLNGVQRALNKCALPVNGILDRTYRGMNIG
jgi:hypothetical protein